MPNDPCRQIHAPRLKACAALPGVTLAALALSIAFVASAAAPSAPLVDVSGLPELEPGWAASNPYRANSGAAEVGRAAFNQSCARCHGADADGSRAAAPDLRRVGRSCGRVRDAALKQRCTEDADYYFVKSVLKGKFKVGIEHMPAWEDVLTPPLVWAIRSFVETARNTR